MRKISACILFACFFINLHGQIKVATNGYVGINNTSPAYNLDVTGTVQFSYNSRAIRFNENGMYPSGNGTILGDYSYKWAQLWVEQPYFMYQPVILSDVRFKNNVQELSGINNKLKMLKPVKYQLTIQKDSGVNSGPDNEQFGFIAQEIMQVFPEIVVPMKEGIMGIRYNELIPILVQAIKEQQAEIERLNEEISNIKSLLK